MWNSTQNRLRLSNLSFHPFKSFLRGISRIWSSTLFLTSCWASCCCSEQQCSPSAGWPLRLTLWWLKLAWGPWQRRVEWATPSHRVQTVWITFPLTGLSFYFALWGPFSFCSSLSKSPSHSLIDKHTPAEIVRLCKHTHILTLTHKYFQFQSRVILQGEGGFTS